MPWHRLTPFHSSPSSPSSPLPFTYRLVILAEPSIDCPCCGSTTMLSES